MAKLREGEELFGADELLRITAEDTAAVANKYKQMGRQKADGVSTQIYSSARKVIIEKARTMNIDLESAARAEGSSLDDYVEDMDEFYEVVSEVAMSYLAGMEEAWPFPILN